MWNDKIWESGRCGPENNKIYGKVALPKHKIVGKWTDGRGI